MTPTELKAAYVTALAEVETLAEDVETTQTAYSAACAALSNKQVEAAALRVQLEAALIAGDI